MFANVSIDMGCTLEKVDHSPDRCAMLCAGIVYI
ncbi:MAG: hypothetical protein ACI8XB_002365, partial [Patiriisocius sp.]